ncbi:hypothetical protein F441_15859 [Phytophthora nicotianae CJ01A1]|uniref:Uncharacterized protein n=2 Tax=Phytophthora nicotianae TaxID=4792 RepID=W2WEP3_PHYNI|nr:hypothetical protein F441_15860 [Phytophthora nicotianae CJ01A1]ETP08049.1 hypothetical protein F441_15859 [Phytophthora nicotianae CJ01A1]
MTKVWKKKPKSKRQKIASCSPTSVRSRSSQVSRRSMSRPPARSPSVAHAKSPESRLRSRSYSMSSHPTASTSPTSVLATPPKAEPSKDDQPPAVVDLTRDESDEDMEEEPAAVPTNSEGTEATRQASPTPPGTP